MLDGNLNMHVTALFTWRITTETRHTAVFIIDLAKAWTEGLHEADVSQWANT